MLGGGGRGLGVVNLFALLYLTLVIGVDDATAGLMYGVLIVFSVPTPLIAGSLSDRLGRKPLIIVAYLGGAAGFVVFLLAGSSIFWLWVGILIMGLFSFAESPQLQALLGDIAPPSIRDASYALYFALAFGVGSLWIAVYGVIIDVMGEATAMPIVFGLMAGRSSGRAGDPADPDRAARPGRGGANHRDDEARDLVDAVSQPPFAPTIGVGDPSSPWAMTPIEMRNPARRWSGGINVPWPTGAPAGNPLHSSLNGSNSLASRSDQLAQTTLSSELPGGLEPVAQVLHALARLFLDPAADELPGLRIDRSDRRDVDHPAGR